MNRIILLIAIGSLAACAPEGTDKAADRQAGATRIAMDNADREVGMPRIANFSQRKLLKNAYEDMDQTTLTYVYSQALDGRFVCLGQAVGFGVSLGTQFTAPQYPQRVRMPGNIPDETALLAQPDPNGLYQPDNGAATIVNLINLQNGEAHTALVEPNVVTVPFRLPASVVAVQCPGDIDPAKVHDAKEQSLVKQHS